MKINELSFVQHKELAKSHDTSSEILEAIYHSKSQSLDDVDGYRSKYEIEILLTSNSNTPVEILAELSWSHYEEIVDNPVFELLLIENGDRHFLKLCLAKSIRTPVETLEKLSCDRDFKIQQEVAKNPNISSKIIDRYAQNEEICLCCIQNLLKHTNKISPETWLLLASHKKSQIRSNFTRYAQAPIDITIALANDSDSKIRSCLARNRHLPPEIFVKLAKDADPQVRQQLAINLLTPLEILLKLAEDVDPQVRQQVAQNWRIPDEILAKLAQDSNPLVRCAVTKNSQIPKDLLAKLAQDSDPDVLDAVAKNWYTPRDSIDQIRKKLKN